MENTILNLQREVHNLREVENYPQEYYYESDDLLSVHGRNPLKYALKIADIIFSRDELSNGVFLDRGTSRLTNRTIMDNNKVDVLQSKLNYF